MSGDVGGGGEVTVEVDGICNSRDSRFEATVVDMPAFFRARSLSAIEPPPLFTTGSSVLSGSASLQGSRSESEGTHV